MAITHRRAAGVDVHEAEHFVSEPPEDAPKGFVNPHGRLLAGVRKFGMNTGELEAIAAL